MRKKYIPFVFTDEVGVGLPSDQPIFGVGILIIREILSLNRSLHDIFTGAVSFHQKHRSRFEFKFNAVTRNNLSFYKAILKELDQNTSWKFSAILIEKDPHSWSSKAYWSAYINLLDGLLKRITSQKIILVTDYLAKPKTEREDFRHLASNVKIANLLQLESQGSLLLQVTDILLGALHFDYRRRALNIKEGKEAKIKLAQGVDELLRNKKKRVTVKKMTAIEWLHAVSNHISKK